MVARLADPVREVFWGALREGHSGRRASALAGVAKSTGQQWLREAGGVPPPRNRVEPQLPSSQTGQARLNWVDRCRIEDLTGQGYRPARIAALMQRARSTITRELARGTAAGRYRAPLGQGAVDASGRRPKTGKLQGNPELLTAVVAGLAHRLSPEQVAGRLRRDHPDDPEMWVSHETIYRALYVQPRGELARQVRAAIKHGTVLRTGREQRKEVSDLLCKGSVGLRGTRWML